MTAGIATALANPYFALAEAECHEFMSAVAKVSRWYGGIPISEKIDDHVYLASVCGTIFMRRYSYAQEQKAQAAANAGSVGGMGHNGGPPLHDTDMTRSTGSAGAPGVPSNANGSGVKPEPPQVTDEALSEIVTG